MRINSRGQACMGIGDGVVSLDGVTIARGGGACWLTDDEVLYQRTPTAGTGGYALQVYDQRSGIARVVDPRGANEIRAGGDVWAAWSSTGVRTSRGDLWPKAGLLDVSREGAIVTCPDRQTGIGAEIRYPNGDAYTVARCRANAVRYAGPVLVWVQDGKVQSDGLASPVTIAAPNYSPVPVPAGSGVWWLLYQDGQRLLLQPWNAPVGYVVHDQPTTFSPDAIALSPTTIRVAWSHTQGEGPDALRVRDIDLGAPRVRLDRPINPPEPPMPEPNYLPQVQAARAVYAGRLASVERGWLITNEAVRRINLVDPAANFGLLAKTSGTNWNGYSIDCVMRRTGETWDVLGDAEGAAKAQWTRTTPTGMTDPSKWRAHVTVPETEPPPVEPPPEPGPGYDDTELRRRITALETWAESFRRG